MKTDLQTDIAIVGAGPAGMAAAIAAAAQGAHVCLIDDNPRPGGQIWRGGPAVAPDTARTSFTALAQSQVRLLSQCRVVAAPGSGLLLLEQADRALSLRYGKLILATGAREQLLPFPGWTLPGVCGAGGLQALVKGGMAIAGKRVVLAGSGPLLLATGQTLRAAGAELLLIAEQADAASLAGFAWGLRSYPAKLRQAFGFAGTLRGGRYKPSSHVIAATGSQRLQQVRLQVGSKQVELACDWLGVGYGLLPNTELLAALGCELAEGAALVNELLQTSVPHVYAAGEATGIGGVDKAMLEGRLAGLAASGALDAARALIPARQQQLGFAALLSRHFSLRPTITTLPQDNTLVCRCEDVSHGRLRAYDNWREAKLQTRCGMGPCQGRICGAACETLYGWSPEGSRPPIQPVRLGSLLQPGICPTHAEASPS
ncbi:FAD-dependent oxidoreductase [Chitinimonas naiadis]